MVSEDGQAIVVVTESDNVTLDKAYVEYQCEWRETTDRVGRWMDRNVS